MDNRQPFGLLLLQLLLVDAAGNAAPSPPGKDAEICLLPRDVGPCKALLPRYYYDRYLQKCRPFMYGGCRGNPNNFKTPGSCEEACSRIEHVPRICRLELREYQCHSRKEQYVFNLRTMTCEKLKPGRCNQNRNRFPDKASCRKFCTPNKGPSFCYSPKDEGLCSANVTRYYFNASQNICEAFSYTGCGGNHNNFVYLKDCNRVCAKGSKNFPIQL
uniref:tissue factor pathway inhibitor 2 n=1 Tax=Jaculus jaculus TaxID=51337 RepID=UPI001E1B5DAE|nr:tissue factor pathway inhibitor 2 [Jaculus jaculus]